MKKFLFVILTVVALASCKTTGYEEIYPDLVDKMETDAFRLLEWTGSGYEDLRKSVLEWAAYYKIPLTKEDSENYELYFKDVYFWYDGKMFWADLTVSYYPEEKYNNTIICWDKLSVTKKRRPLIADKYEFREFWYGKQMLENGIIPRERGQYRYPKNRKYRPRYW